MEFTRSEKVQTKVNGVGSPASNNLREEQEERQRLEKSNFDLKMRNYYLEENLKRFQDGEHTTSSLNDSSRSEITSLKLQLEERNMELDHRNMILMKAKSAIEQLKVELERLRQENERQHDLEHRMTKLKQMNDEMESEYRGKVSQLEIQLAAARQLTINKEQELHTVENKLVQLEMTYSHTTSKADELHDDRDKLQEQWLQAQQRISHLEDELTQQRAHVDLYNLQMDEQTEETERMKTSYKELFTMKARSDEEYKVRISDLNAQYELQIRTMRANHEQEVERLRDGHVKMLADIRENYQMEIQVAKSQLDRALSDARQNEGQDVARVRDECNLRLNEKNEEIRSLRATIESERERANTLHLELETTRSELRRKVETMERMSVESSSKSEELKIAQLVHKELNQCRTESNELREQLRHQEVENAHKTSRVEQLQTTLESARGIIREQEASLDTARLELTRLQRESGELTLKADTVESISRENEKLKAMHNQLQTEILELNHRHSDARRDFSQSAEEIQRLLREVSALKEALADCMSDCDTLRGTKENLQMSLQSERERISGVEASLNEHRAMLSTSRVDLDREREGKLRAEQEVAHCGLQIEDLRRNLGNACTMSYRAMTGWDSALSNILDGEIFRDITSNNSNYNNGRSASAGVNQGGGVSALISLFGAKQQQNSTNGGVRRPLISQPSGPYGRGHVQQRDEEESEVDVSALDSDQLLQHVAVRIERVSLKIERTKKIRSLFDAQSQRLVQSLQIEFNSAQERSSLLFHKVTESAGDVTNLKAVLDRDRRQRDSEITEIKNFREVLLGEHSTQLKDSEQRYAQLAQQMEQERQQTEREKKISAELREELRTLQATCTEMKADLRELERTERVVSDLSARTSELGDMNRSLSRENESKNRIIESTNAELQDLKQERMTLLANLERLSAQLQAKEEAVQDCEERLTRGAKEMDRLRARQINPELAQTILDTQSILQSSARGTGRSPQHDHKSAGYHAHSATSQSALYVEQLQHILEVVTAAHDLIDKSAEAVNVFESLLNQHGSSSRSNSIAAALEADLSELLELNSKVAIQVHQAANELKRAVRRQESKLLTVGAIIPPVTTSYTQSNVLRNGSSPGDRNYHQQSATAMRTRVDEENDIGSNLFGKMATSTTATYGSNSQFPSSRRAAQTQHYTSPPQQQQDSSGSRYDHHSTSNPVYHHGGSGPLLNRSDLSPEKDNGYVYAQNGNSSMRGADEYAQSRVTSSRDRDLVPHTQQVHFGGGSGGTPITPSRPSVSRLSKLGSDLQALTSKLDSYGGRNNGSSSGRGGGGSASKFT